jgi:hypothetical protein
MIDTFEYIVSEIVVEGREILSLPLLERIPAAALPLGASLTSATVVTSLR